jgi:Thioredoxin-like
MKYTGVILMALVLSGCMYFYSKIEITGTATGIDNGIAQIKDDAGKTVFDANIRSGKFHIREQALAKRGYYKLNYLTTGGKRPVYGPEFQLYLEPGTYTITSNPKGPDSYPIISSSSKIQNELSAWYPIADSIKQGIHARLTALVAIMNDPKLCPMGAKLDTLGNQIKAAQNQEAGLTPTILAQFIAKYPQSEVVAHLMANTEYDSDPVANYKLYQKFSGAAKNSEDGQEIGDRLSHLVKMMPGQPAPALVGEMPDGKKLDIKGMHKKIILVEFWRAAIVICRKHHQTLIAGMVPNLSPDFGIISVSLDEKRDWWTSAIKDDKMTWPQISDGKGLDSPNIDNWGISDVPLYCLIDGNGRMIDKNVEFDNVMFNVNDYLKKHP